MIVNIVCKCYNMLESKFVKEDNYRKYYGCVQSIMCEQKLTSTVLGRIRSRNFEGL